MALFAAALCVTVACDDGYDDPYESSSDQPWTRQFIFGNTAINSGVIVTNQDGISADYLTDYVYQDALPNVDMEAFSTQVLLPVSAGFYTEVSNVTITAGRTDATRTPDFFLRADYAQTVQIGGESYEVHELVGVFVGDPALRPENFANVVFDFDVSYLDGSGSLVSSRNKTIEIYKR